MKDQIDNTKQKQELENALINALIVKRNYKKDLLLLCQSEGKGEGLLNTITDNSVSKKSNNMTQQKQSLIKHQVECLQMMIETMADDHNKGKQSSNVTLQCYHVGALSVIETLSVMVKELNETVKNEQ